MDAEFREHIAHDQSVYESFIPRQFLPTRNEANKNWEINEQNSPLLAFFMKQKWCENEYKFNYRCARAHKIIEANAERRTSERTNEWASE